MLFVLGLILVVVGIVVTLFQPSAGLLMIGVSLLIFAIGFMGVDLKAIRDRLLKPSKPKSPKPLR